MQHVQLDQSAGSGHSTPSFTPEFCACRAACQCCKICCDVMLPVCVPAWACLNLPEISETADLECVTVAL